MVAGPHPDTVTYTTLMDACCKIREMAKAQSVLREMLDRELQPTVVTFNVLMNGFCMSGMLEDGERLLKWMIEKGIVPNAGTYSSLMKQYCIRNNMRTTTYMYRSKCAGWVMPDNNTYTILIKGHFKARNMKEAWKFAEARELFEEMRRPGVVADRETYSIFVDMNYEEEIVSFGFSELASRVIPSWDQDMHSTWVSAFDMNRKIDEAGPVETTHSINVSKESQDGCFVQTFIRLNCITAKMIKEDTPGTTLPSKVGYPHSMVELELGVMSREDAGALASQKETTEATDLEDQLKTKSH
ncbi:unnamed protein product [Prunus armeniaca]|uniref:Pentatricopeptide repeat-containing protein n=1 Tax=Prunus armeniaca TaxID=36596 RepID=A0A6J5TLK0_PRUAR|nr:unnamed protein product [Prunus armeniaca]